MTITVEQLINPYYAIIADPTIPYGPENMLTTIERKALLAVALMHNQGKAKLEIGTFEGFTTAVIAKVFPANKVYTVDLPPNVPHIEQPGVHLGHHYKSTRCDNVIQILQSSMELDPEQFEEIDFAFIDGDHEFESVFHDIAVAMYLLVKGGGLMLDDVFMDGPSRVIQEVSQDIPEIVWTFIAGTKLAYATV